MTGPIYIRPQGYLRWCRLAELGGERHTTACGASVSTDEPVLVIAAPAAELVCGAVRSSKRGDAAICRRDAQHSDT